MGLFLAAMITTLLAGLGEAVAPVTVAAGVALLLGVLLAGGLNRRRLLITLLGGLTGGAALLNIPPPMPPPPEGEVITLRGVVAERDDRADSVRLLVDQATSPNWRASGLLQVTAYRQTVTLLPGDRVEMTVRLRPPEGSRVPGAFDYAAWLRRNDIQATASLKEPPVLLARGEGWFWNRARQEIAQWLHELLPGIPGGLAAALLVGKRGGLEQAFNDQLLAAGVFHLVSISGLHLTLVAGWCFAFFRLLLIPCLPLSRQGDVKRPAAVLAFVPLLTYAALSGLAIPTLRSVVMVTVLLLAYLLGRFHQVWRALALAAALLLLAWPEQLLDAGFQLSFIAVAVLLALMRLEHGGSLGWFKGFIVISLILGLALAPLEAHHFHRLTPYALLGNLVGIPVVSALATPLGLLALLLRPVFPGVAEMLLLAMGHSLEWVQAWVGWVSQLPGAWFRLPGPTQEGLALYLVAGVGVLAAPLLAGRVFYALLGVLGLLWPRELPAPGLLHLAVLDVGQGQSVVVRSPEGAWSVVDAGGAVTSRFDVGEAAISAYLWHRGVTGLARLVISHPQSDHMAGAARVVRNFPVGELWLGPQGEREPQALRELVELARGRGVVVRRVKAGVEERDGEMVWRVLHPSREGGRAEVNNRSLVVELGLGDARFLLPGDIEAGGERVLLKGGEIKPVTLLLAPHHGSATSSTEAFVAATRPGHVVFSVGRYNPFGFPKGVVVERWRGTGAKLWRTDRDGTLVVEAGVDGVVVKGTP